MPSTLLSRFIFFSIRSRRLLGGTQESLQLICGSGDTDLQDSEVGLDRFLDDRAMDMLMAGAESAFNKGAGNQLMKSVRVCCA
jgi:hypothetical protein